MTPIIPAKKIQTRPHKVSSIIEVIHILEAIIRESERNNDALGYFAVLYQKVTKKVKEGIENDFFDNGPRMEKLDILFAQRYIDAYYAYKNQETVTASWERAFDLSSSYWPIVLQHLLVGMNAHINLDLGIAAVSVSQDEDINDLEADFIRINEILSSLVDEVQNDLADIWPVLRPILRIAGKIDNQLVDFSMRIAREGAWGFAKRLAAKSDEAMDAFIAERDTKVARKADIITHPGRRVKMIMNFIRLRERGTVTQKIRALRE